jgi:hypothetical protein
MSVAILASCTSTSAGNVTPQSATSTHVQSSSSSSLPALSLQKFVSDPCSLLTSTQAAELGEFRSTEPTNDRPNGPGCIWRGTEPTENSTYELTLGVTDAALSIFRENTKSYSSFREAKVAGYPTISYDTAGATRDCTTILGISDKETVIVQVSTAVNDEVNDGKPCDRTERLGATVIENLTAQ